MTKKKNRRNSAKYPALEAKLNLRNRFELIDYDYVNKLNDDEKDFLNRFTEEFIGAKLNHEGEVLHNTKELRKDCYDKNNARNRDVLTKQKSGGILGYLEEIKEPTVETEDKLIEKIDNKE